MEPSYQTLTAAIKCRNFPVLNQHSLSTQGASQLAVASAVHQWLCRFARSSSSRETDSGQGHNYRRQHCCTQTRQDLIFVRV